MRSSVIAFTAPGRAELLDRAIAPPEPGRILIEAELSLISAGTERTLLKQAPDYPFFPGYSLVGHVAAVGEGVTGFAVGDRVAASASHGSLVACDADLAFPIPDGVSSQDAAFFTVGATALYAVRLAQIAMGDPVLVVGQGLIGLIATQIARCAGAVPVIGVDLDRKRLDLALALGADFVFEAGDEQGLAGAAAALAGGGVAATIELSGAPVMIDRAIGLTRRRGRVVAASLNPAGYKVDLYGEAWMKGLSLVGAYFNSRPWRLDTVEMAPPTNWPLRSYRGGRFEGNDIGTSAGDSALLLDLLAHGRIKVAPLVSEAVDAKEAPALFDRLPRSEFLGALIRWKP